MYPALNRLRKSREIEQIFKRGRTFSTPAFVFRFLPNRQGPTRLAVVVGTKVHKRAVKRNLIKRRIREALKTELPNLKSGFDIIVAARPAALGQDLSEIKSAIKSALQRMGLLKG